MDDIETAQSRHQRFGIARQIDFEVDASFSRTALEDVNGNNVALVLGDYACDPVQNPRPRFGMDNEPDTVRHDSVV